MAPGGLLTKSTPGGGSSTLISIDGVNEWRAGDGDLPNGSNLDYNWFGDPLPIELINFSVREGKKAHILEWSTATETNNDYFLIEFSVDGENWSLVDLVDGAGNSQALINYQTIHYNSFEITFYYRLTQVDFDGKKQSFPIISLHHDSTKSVEKVYNIMGQEVNESYNGIVIKTFSSGRKEKLYQRGF